MKILLLGLVFFYAHSLYTMKDDPQVIESKHPKRFTHYKHALKKRKQKLFHSLKSNDLDSFKNNLGNINVARLTNSKKNSFFHITVQRGFIKFVTFLLKEKRVSANQLNKKSQTPLFQAFKLPVMVKLLAQFGVNPNHQDKCGNTVLHQIIIQQGKLFHLKTVIEAQYNQNIKINPLTRNRKGLTPLGAAYRLKATQGIIDFLEEFTLKCIEPDERCCICRTKAKKIDENKQHLTLCCTTFLCEDCMNNSYNIFSNCFCGYPKGKKKPTLSLE